MGIYGIPVSSEYWQIWNLINDLMNHNDLPFLIGGDRNGIFNMFEKSGGLPRLQSLMNSLATALRENELLDLGFLWY